MMEKLQQHRPDTAVNVLQPHGWVWLDAYLAGDVDVVNGAKASFGQYVTEIGPKEIGLINFLVKNHHTSPLEHGYFRFLVRCPIGVSREWMRHRTWSYNEFSTRYSEVTGDDFSFYLPMDSVAMRTQTGKPGAYIMEPMQGAKAAAAYKLMQRHGEACFNLYRLLIEETGLAKEVARNVLPLGMYTTFVASVDPLNLMRFLVLRTHETAPYEIRVYARQLELYFAQTMPHTYNAYDKYFRPRFWTDAEAFAKLEAESLT